MRTKYTEYINMMDGLVKDTKDKFEDIDILDRMLQPSDGIECKLKLED